jgi:hypothetical protein
MLLAKPFDLNLITALIIASPDVERLVNVSCKMDVEGERFPLSNRLLESGGEF